MKEHLANIYVLFLKEWRSYFNTPIGYIFSSLFLLLVNFLFFFGLGQNSFWDLKSASMEQFFLWIPILFTIFIPAITMGLWAEEEKSGTLEVLLTLPFRDWEVILGKFFSAWVYTIFVLMITILTPFTVMILGNPDLGIVFSGYLGSGFLAAGYITIGLIVSALTRDQISAYMISLLLCLLFFLMGYQPVLKYFGSELGNWISFLSLSRHFETFRLGIFDIRELVFFFSFIGTGLILNLFILRGRK
jgi:ABC-2 type transport system permease protein